MGSFADDTKVSLKITDHDDVRRLQGDLHNVFNWEKENNMELNPDKFVVLKYGKIEDLKHNIYRAPSGEEIKRSRNYNVR